MISGCRKAAWPTALQIRCLQSCPCYFVNNELAIAIKLVIIHFHGFWVPSSGMTDSCGESGGRPRITGAKSSADRVADKTFRSADVRVVRETGLHLLPFQPCSTGTSSSSSARTTPAGHPRVLRGDGRPARALDPVPGGPVGRWPSPMGRGPGAVEPAVELHDPPLRPTGAGPVVSGPGAVLGWSGRTAGRGCVVLPSVYRTVYDGDETRVPELLGRTLLEGMACGTGGVTNVASCRRWWPTRRPDLSSRRTTRPPCGRSWNGSGTTRPRPGN